MGEMDEKTNHIVGTVGLAIHHTFRLSDLHHINQKVCCGTTIPRIHRYRDKRRSADSQQELTQTSSQSPSLSANVAHHFPLSPSPFPSPG